MRNIVSYIAVLAAVLTWAARPGHAADGFGDGAEEFWRPITVTGASPEHRLSDIRLRVADQCVSVVKGDPHWTNAKNRNFYNWLIRHYSRNIARQRNFCGLDGCPDLEFLAPFFTLTESYDHSLTPFELVQQDELEPRNVLIVGAHPREVQWFVDNSTLGTIFAIDHSKMVVKGLSKAREFRKWPDRVKIKRVSFLHPDLSRILAEMNGGTPPKIHFILSMWSGFYEFNEREQKMFLERSYGLLTNPGGLVIDFLADPLNMEESRGYVRLVIDIEKMDLPEHRKQLLRERTTEPPVLNAFIPNRSLFLDMIHEAGFEGHSGFVGEDRPDFLYGSEQQRALYIFEKNTSHAGAPAAFPSAN